MPIDFNPFGPVCKNILIPLAKSLYEPYGTLYEKSIQPLYNSIIQPCKGYDQAVKRCKALIQTAELVVQFSVYFFFYEKGWHVGVHYLGFAGGAVAFSLIYAAGCWVDTQLKTNMNDICTGTWLYYKGIRNLGTNREGVLASVIVAGYLTKEREDSIATNGWDAKRTKAAEWLAQCFFKKESILPVTPADVRGGEAIDGPQNLPDGEGE